MVEALARFGLDANMPVVPLTIDSPLAERLAYADMCEAGIGAVLNAFASGVPDAVGVSTRTTTITGEDGNDVTLSELSVAPTVRAAGRRAGVWLHADVLSLPAETASTVNQAMIGPWSARNAVRMSAAGFLRTAG